VDSRGRRGFGAGVYEIEISGTFWELELVSDVDAGELEAERLIVR
jgi:hypothetical protein